MKRILVFSDLHASKRALEDIIPSLEKVDLSICCGDFLGYGKDIDYCLEYVLKNIDLIVIGNHERLAITNENLEKQPPAVKESILNLRDKLSLEQKKALSALPKEIWYQDMYIAHSIGDEYLRNKSDFLQFHANLAKDVKYVFFGHTHEQVLFKFEERVIVNPGSITKGRGGSERGFVLTNGDKFEFIKLEAIL